MGETIAAPARQATRGRLRARGARAGGPSLARRIGLIVLTIALLLLAWEGGKALFGTPWRVSDEVIWNPPARIQFFNDVNLPHVPAVLAAFVAPWQRGQDLTLAGYLVGAALYTWREAALGFALGALLGLGLATAFVHSRLAERALQPYVIASQTVPIIALAPMIVFAFGQSVTSVVIIATYLTFFPVTIAMVLGLRTFDPRALELMRSYAASRGQIFWKLRFPASLPFLFTALKIAATASIVGAIVGEGPGGISEGLGRVIITFNQYYITGPEKLWAAIIATALLGIAFYTLVSLVQRWVLRGRGQPAY